MAPSCILLRLSLRLVPFSELRHALPHANASCALYQLWSYHTCHGDSVPLTCGRGCRILRLATTCWGPVGTCRLMIDETCNVLCDRQHNGDPTEWYQGYQKHDMHYVTPAKFVWVRANECIPHTRMRAPPTTHAQRMHIRFQIMQLNTLLLFTTHTHAIFLKDPCFDSFGISLENSENRCMVHSPPVSSAEASVPSCSSMLARGVRWAGARACRLPKLPEVCTAVEALEGCLGDPSEILSNEEPCMA